MTHGAWVLLAALGAVLAGCSSTSTCNRDADALSVCNAQGESGPNAWFSSAYHDPGKALSSGETGYQYFPPARTITFHHHLGSNPIPTVTLAFYENGSLAPTAGNQALFECMDDEVIQIKNDTCSDFYIWVQAEGSGIPSNNHCDTTAAPACAAAGAAAVGAGGAPDESVGAGGAQP